ncbi:MAG: metal ABC transporter ATP-binding protein [Elusimicrobiota bacterium]|jgi:zinc transport system ATP-binding protein|nr:metal ABC transporter ATP-binding protein [Elusimicrobiota bacterium]
MNLIEVKNLAFAYNSSPVLEDITFAVKPGDFIGLLGHNGSGKTTLIQLILGILKTKEGKIKIMGQKIEKFNQWSKIGYLQQKSAPPSLMPLTAFEVVRLGRVSTKGLPRIFNKIDNKKTQEVMAKTNCLEYKNKLFYELSGGQQQRVLLARAIINNPALIILDEPSTALDASSRGSFFDLISNLNKKDGATILLITHDMAEIGKYINKFFILDKKIIFYGDKQTFCKSPEVANHFGPYTQHIMDHLHTTGPCPFGGHSWE